MTPQERAVIDGIFERLKPAASQPRDPEVERYIADLIRQQPHAPYAMAQSVYVQEQALLNQQQQIEQMQAEIAQLQQAMQARPAPQPQNGGFLSGLFGGGSQQPQPQNVPAYGQRGQQQGYAPLQPPAPAYGQPQGGPQQGGPWGQQPPAQPQQRQGMGFLGTAAAAAAGVAGGMMLGNVLSSAFGGGQAHAAPNPHQNQNNFLGQGQQSGAAPEQGYPTEDGYDDTYDAGYDDSDSGNDSYDV